MIPLAVYGTLRQGERNADLVGGARLLGTARIAGRLHRMAATTDRAYPYPALMPATDDGDEVVVEILDLVDAEALRTIDALEAFDPADPEGSEYVRSEVDVRNGPVPTAWVYLYNGPQEAVGDRIVDGDWVGRDRALD